MKCSFLCVVVLTCLFAAAGYSQIPRTFSYQGVLTDTLGNPMPDANYIVTFRLYDASTAGNVVWTGQKNLPVKRGLFSTLLGDAPAFSPSLQFDHPYWLSLEVFGTEMSPRVPLTSVAYSLNSARAETAMVASISVSDTTWKRSGANIYHSGSNVGIGTSNPAAPLSIQTISGSDLYFPSTGTNADIVADYQLNINAANVNLNTANQYRLSVLNNGFVGIGTTNPSELLELGNNGNLLLKATANDAGDIIFQNSGSAQKGRIWSSPSLDRQLLLSSKDNVADIAIDSSGNVGIGTTTPTQKLDVNGSVDAVWYYFTTGKYIFSVGGQYCGITDHWIPNLSNSQDLGTATWRWRTLYTNNAPNVSSDYRLKKDIADLRYGLNEVVNLRPVSYRLKEGNGDQVSLGLIAQEVQKLIPEIVTADDSKEKILGMRYDELIPVMIKAIQEQQQQIDELKTLVRSLAAEKEKSGGKSIGQLR